MVDFKIKFVNIKGQLIEFGNSELPIHLQLKLYMIKRNATPFNGMPTNKFFNKTTIGTTFL